MCARACERESPNAPLFIVGVSRPRLIPKPFYHYCVPYNGHKLQQKFGEKSPKLDRIAIGRHKGSVWVYLNHYKKRGFADEFQIKRRKNVYIS